MRRKKGTLVPLEIDILKAIKCLESDKSYAYQIVKHMNRPRNNGPVYKALLRLERFGLITSQWEDSKSARLGRPLRRYYTLVEGNRNADL